MPDSGEVLERVVEGVTRQPRIQKLAETCNSSFCSVSSVQPSSCSYVFLHVMSSFAGDAKVVDGTLRHRRTVKVRRFTSDQCVEQPCRRSRIGRRCTTPSVSSGFWLLDAKRYHSMSRHGMQGHCGLCPMAEVSVG